MSNPTSIAGRTLHEWVLFARRDDCLERMVPSDLRQLIGAISSPVSEKFECQGRKQTLPEPGECNWPDCGCDSAATKVIESLIEQGWTPPR